MFGRACIVIIILCVATKYIATGTPLFYKYQSTGLFSIYKGTHIIYEANKHWNRRQPKTGNLLLRCS